MWALPLSVRYDRIVATGATRERVVRVLREHRAALVEMGVSKLALFGSIARGEEAPDSDVDLLVEFDRRVGLFHFVHVKLYLEEILGRRVDLVTTDALHPALRNRILGEAVHAA